MKITINGKEVIVVGNGELTYEEICNIAYPPQYTVTYHAKGKEGGFLSKEHSIKPENGMIIDCIFTGNA